MNRHREEQHAKQVLEWSRSHLEGMPPAVQLQAFKVAILALEKRTLMTLSNVTLYAILNRVITESQRHFPFLTAVQADAEGISLDHLSSAVERQPAAAVTEAFCFFITEFLIIIENLTAGILTKPLYEELSQMATSAKSGKDRGEQ